MGNFINIQSQWVKFAEEFDRRSNSSINESILQVLMEEKLDEFIQLSLDSKADNITQYQLDADGINAPEKLLHDRLFLLMCTLEYLKPTDRISQTLIKNLMNSLMKCFLL